MVKASHNKPGTTEGSKILDKPTQIEVEIRDLCALPEPVLEVGWPATPHEMHVHAISCLVGLLIMIDSLWQRYMPEVDHLSQLKRSQATSCGLC